MSNYNKNEDIETILRSLDEKNISYKNKTILITGGAGFLGSWICDILIAQDAKVICLDNLFSGQKDNIDHLLDNSNFKFINHDISQEYYPKEDIDMVMHLASRASPFEFSVNPIQILKANTLGTWIALGIAKKFKAKFLYTSTSEVYGDPDDKFIPTDENYNGNVNPLGKRACYDEAKRAGEAYVIAYRYQHNLDVRIARIFNTYGPRMRADDVYGRVVPIFIDQALDNKNFSIFGDGTQTRSFTYITDQVIGLLTLGEKEGISGEVVNIGNNKEMKILDLAKLIKKLTNSNSDFDYFPLPPDDPKRRTPYIKKAKKLLDWQPQIKTEVGLQKMINYVKDN